MVPQSPPLPHARSRSVQRAGPSILTRAPLTAGGAFAQAIKEARAVHRDSEAAFAQAFAAVDKDLRCLPQHKGDTGATGVALLFSGERLIVANCGDCRTILGRKASDHADAGKEAAEEDKRGPEKRPQRG